MLSIEFYINTHTHVLDILSTTSGCWSTKSKNTLYSMCVCLQVHAHQYASKRGQSKRNTRISVCVRESGRVGVREIRPCWVELLAFLYEDKACSGLVQLNPAAALSVVLNWLEAFPSLFISFPPFLLPLLHCLYFFLCLSQLYLSFTGFTVVKHSKLPQWCKNTVKISHKAARDSITM